MNLQYVLKSKGLSIAKCAKFTGIPYSSLYNIVNKKASLMDCDYKTVFKIASMLGVSTERLVYNPEDFQTFRNELHHRLKRLGDLDFIIESLSGSEIRNLWEDGYPLYSLYYLSMVDHLSNAYDLPLSSEHADIRDKKLQKLFYCGPEEEWKLQNALPEFMEHNIVEGDLYDAI